MNEIPAALAVSPTDPTNIDAAELSAEKLTVRFQGLAAISDVSLTVRRHEVFGLIGPNGAGKTTLVNCLTGFQAPTEGRVLVGRRKPPVGSRHASGRSRSRAPSKPDAVRGDVRARNARSAAVGLGLHRRNAIAHSRASLDAVGLPDKAALPAGVLAYTDQRRLGIARAMVISPAFVLLDEPAAGVSRR